MIRSLLLLALVSSCCADSIIRNDFETPGIDGAYKWAIQTEGGIFHEQRGTPRSVDGQSVVVVEGQYQYTAPNGQIINVIYRADETGYYAMSNHKPNTLRP